MRPLWQNPRAKAGRPQRRAFAWDSSASHLLIAEPDHAQIRRFVAKILARLDLSDKGRQHNRTPPDRRFFGFLENEAHETGATWLGSFHETVNEQTNNAVNPILPPHAADPWMILHGGNYYYSESRNKRRIFIRRSRSIAGIGLDEGTCVWSAPAQGRNSNNIWAPELHLIDGRWFIYFAADDGRNANHRMWVLEAESSDPCGKYRCRGCLETGGWAIDGTVLVLDDGRKYFIWSGWPGRRNGQQNLYISPMRDPLTLGGPRVLLATPDQPWERVAMPICEGPQVLKRNGDLFIVYSASGSWTSDYCLGLLHNKTQDVLNPAAWVKHGPVFKKTDQVWGVGHCSFVKSLNRNEDWIIYHSKSSRQPGWKDRDVHAKPFFWTSDGFPDFGIPVPRAQSIQSPLTPRPRTNRVAA